MPPHGGQVFPMPVCPPTRGQKERIDCGCQGNYPPSWAGHQIVPTNDVTVQNDPLSLLHQEQPHPVWLGHGALFRIYDVTNGNRR